MISTNTHVYSTLKQHENGHLYVVLTWNTRNVFIASIILLKIRILSYIAFNRFGDLLEHEMSINGKH